MRLRHFFHTPLELCQSQPRPSGSSQITWQYNKDEGFDNRQFHNPSKFNPRGPGALEAFICSNDTHNSLPTRYKRPRDNLTQSERKALKELKALSDRVIIKPADKGSAVVLMDREDYLKEGIRQLSDLNFYRPVQQDLSAEHMLSIRDIVSNMYAHKEISKKVKDFLLDFPMRTSRFYLLPKIHKGKFPPPGRPIISGNGCPTERISQFVDFFMKELSPKGPSFLKDTTDFLQTLHAVGKTPPGTLLVTLDVTSLYTNIPNDEGIRAAEFALEDHRPFGKEPFNNSIIDLLRLVLTCNNFTFNGQHYLQVGGTAMGTKTAPNYAVNFMNFFENRFVYTYFIQPLYWKRYIDDIFMM